MPFFKRRKNPQVISSPTSPTPPIGTPNGILSPTLPKEICLPWPPPLQNFTPPQDVVAEATNKSNIRNSSNVADLLGWARDYFSAFLKSEDNNNNYCDLFELWETADGLLEEWKRRTKNKTELSGTSDEVDDKGFSALKEKVLIFSSKLEAKQITVNGLPKVPLEGEDSLTAGASTGKEQDRWLLWLSEAHAKLYENLQTICLPKYLESKCHVKCQMDLFTNQGTLSLYDVLLNQNALFYFMEFADQENKRDVLEFWLAATNFTDQFQIFSYSLSPPLETMGSRGDDSQSDNSVTIDVKTAVGDAMVLYEKYISLQAPHPLGLRDEIRSEIEAKICSEEQVINCFNTAIIEAFAFLHVTCFEGFLKSSLFLAFLSDLIGCLNSNSNNNSASSCCKSPQPPDSGSIGSSGSVRSYPISTNSSLTSPTPVRERGKLSMGRVNALGRFEADMDLDLLSFKSESNLTKTVKKFINFDDKEKAKEELAWQVAAMIVNEVTSVTMGPAADPNAI